MIDFWHWWVGALLLAGAEAVLPGAAFLWLGAAAAVVGVAVLAWPEMPVEVQFLLFGGLSIGAVFGTRFWLKKREDVVTTLHLNRRAEQYIGTVHVLETPIVNGRGRAIVGDSHWTVEGPDLPSGATVRVVGVDGVLLKVEKA